VKGDFAFVVTNYEFLLCFLVIDMPLVCDSTFIGLRVSVRLLLNLMDCIPECIVQCVTCNIIIALEPNQVVKSKLHGGPDLQASQQTLWQPVLQTSSAR
jgi:hypothetical protein